MKSVTHIGAAWLLTLTTLFAQSAEWQQTNGPLGGDVNALMLTDAGTLIAGTRLGGLYRSTNAGATWERIPETSQAPFLFVSVWDLTRNSQGHLFAATNRGVYRSTDGGATWTAFRDGFTNPFVEALAINSADVIFAGTRGGMFRSEDSGETWVAFNNGLAELHVQAVAVTPLGDVLAGTQDGLFLSSDNGDNWSEISSGLSNKRIYAIFPVSEDTLLVGTLGGAFLSTDHGANWNKLDVVFGSIYSFVRQSNTTLYAGGGGFLFRSTDNGVTWSQGILEKLEGGAFWDILVLPSGNLMAATSTYGVVRSSDAGATWQPANTQLAVTEVVELASAPSGELFAGTGDGVFRTRDGGDTWESLFTPDLPLLDVRAMASHPTGRLFVGANGILALSDDNGESWTQADSSLNERFPESVAFGQNQEVYVGFYERIFKSTDGGDTWSALPDTFPQATIQELAVAPDGAVFAGTRSSGVFRSTDGGASWQPINNGLGASPDMTAFLFLPNGDVLASGFDGVFRSGDSGDTWQKLGNVPVLGVKDLVQDSAGNLFITMRGGGVAVSEDDGATWTSINDGLWNKDATALFVTEGDRVYVGTRGAGVFSARFGPTSVDSKANPQPITFVLRQNYPNPFNPETRIRYRLASSADVTLAVFNPLGQLVRTLATGHRPAGEHVVTWDGRDAKGRPVASGVYVYRLSASAMTQSRKMVLTR